MRNYYKEKKQISLIFFSFFLFFLIVLIKAFYIQVVNKEKLLKYSKKQILREFKIYPNRGNIYDREGNSLAIYNLSYNMLNETDTEFNNLLNAIQLLRVTLASRPPPENLKKQIYKKVCNKLNSIDFNLNEELLSQWCLE